MKRARQRWDAQDMDGRRDDITAIVIELTCREEAGEQSSEGRAGNGVGSAAGDEAEPNG